jgi:hypothetical protein
MKGSRITPLQALEGPHPPEGTMLLLIEPARVPPHLALIRDASYYSLSIKGVELEKDGHTLLRTLDRKGKPYLLIPFEAPSDEKDASGIFSSYEGQEPPVSSCLAPLRDLCGLTGNEGIATVHDLLRELERQGQLRPPFYFRNMETPEDGEFRIPDYGEEEVREHLQRYGKGRSVR